MIAVIAIFVLLVVAGVMVLRIATRSEDPIRSLVVGVLVMSVAGRALFGGVVAVMFLVLGVLFIAHGP